MSIKCVVCDMQESFAHLFFECEYARDVWSIFLGPSLAWNHRPGLSWSEVVAGFVKSFDFNMNRFWSILSCEVLWVLWKERNEEVFQNKKRMLTKFNNKLTHFFIMSQVSPILEISKEKFMTPICEGAL
ncbi:hypothetical protein SUGI_0126220 [Cryptomeria japonica]|nr:hypothetical protein SUGI_0126220 [Cryptomeria japonica]